MARARGAKAPAGVRKCEEEVARAAIQLLDREPFFAHVLGALVRVVGASVTPTAAVGFSGGLPTLFVNPTFFVGLPSRESRVAVIKHEVLHLVLRHLHRDRARRPHPLVWNLAADLVVNQLVGRWPLPAGAITLATFPTLALAADQTLEHYYDRLLTLPREETDAHAGATDHEPWTAGVDEGERLAGEATLERVIGSAAERIGAHSWGTLPGPVREIVELVMAKRRPELDWRRVIRLFASSSRRTRVRQTMKRPSRRFATLPGLKVQRLSRIAVAVDTSGSISDDVLAAFFSEIHGVWRAGADVVVVECDAAVQRAYAYRGVFPRGVAGRGGTAFDPVFAWMREHASEPWDGCIFLTDACGPAPEVRAPCPLLWVVVGDADARALGVGRATRLRV